LSPPTVDTELVEVVVDVACPTGFYCSAATAYPCPKGTWNNLTGQEDSSKCNACPMPERMTTLHEGTSSVEDCICVFSFYKEPESGRCSPCPIPGSDCSTMGTTLATMPLHAGYWRAGRNSSNVRPCPDAFKVDGSGCTGKAEAPCRTGLAGIYCLQCDNVTNAYYSSDDSECYDCRKAGGGVLLPWLMICLIVIVLLLLMSSTLWRYCRRSGRRSGRRSVSSLRDYDTRISRPGLEYTNSVPDVEAESNDGAVSILDAQARAAPSDVANIGLDPQSSLVGVRSHLGGTPDSLALKFSSAVRVCASGLTAEKFLGTAGSKWLRRFRSLGTFAARIFSSIATCLKITWSFYQVVTLVPLIYAVTLPPSVKAFLDAIRFVVEINLGFASSPMQCAGLGGYLPWLMLVSCAPLVLMGAAPLIGLWCALGRKVNDDESLRTLLSEVAHRTLYLEVMINFFTFPIISSTAFSAFECEEVEAGRFYLVGDYSVECATSMHASIVALSVFFIALHVVALPLCFLLLLVRAQRPGASCRLKEAMSFLHAPYELHSYAWEFVETLRKLLLVGFSRIMFAPGSLSRLIVAVLISTSTLTFLTLRRPYRKTLDNYLSVALSFSLMCFLLLCVCLNMGHFVEQVGDTLSSSVEGRYSFDSVLMTLLMMLFVLCGLILLALLLVHEIREERRRNNLLSLEDETILRNACKESASGKTKGWKKTVANFAKVLEGAHKHASDLNELITGKPENAARGIYHFMRVPDPFAGTSQQLEDEVRAFVDTVMQLPDDEVVARYKDPWEKDPTAEEIRAKVRKEVQGNLHYIMYEETSELQCHNGVRDLGRGTVTLSYFLNHENAREAQLSEAHVVALRFYTTHAFKYLNNPLRRTKEYFDVNRPHPMPLMITYISEGIKKLRAVYAAKGGGVTKTVLWRGMKNLRVSDAFMEMRRGGTELAPMSTTSDLSIAAHYGVSEGSLVLRVKVDNFMQHGADVQWLSAFPAEAEVVFPPLTYLQPTGRTQAWEMGDNMFYVVEVEPHLP